MSTSISRVGVALMAVAVGFISFAGTQAAQADVTCRGTISNRTISDNIIVPAGQRCVLDNVVVDGNVRTQGRANLTVAHSTVKGNVEGFDHGGLVVQGSNVDGNIISDRGTQAVVRLNRVGGNIEMFSNTQTLRINRNVVDGNLVCKSNRGGLTGADNRVEGDKEDQCRDLKQVTWLYTPLSGSLRAAADGHVYVYGQLHVYDTYGNPTGFRYQSVHIQTRQPGGSWTTVRTAGTNYGTGYFIAAVPRRAGAEVRVVYNASYWAVTSTSRLIGRIA